MRNIDLSEGEGESRKKEERGSCNKDVFMSEDETEKKTEVNKKGRLLLRLRPKPQIIYWAIKLIIFIFNQIYATVSQEANILR